MNIYYGFWLFKFVGHVGLVLHLDDDIFVPASSPTVHKRRLFLKNMCCCRRDDHVTTRQGDRFRYLMMSFGECGGSATQEREKSVPQVLEGAPSS